MSMFLLFCVTIGTFWWKGLCMLQVLKAPMYAYCQVVLAIGTLVRECNWAGYGASFWTVAKQALDMSLCFLQNILKPDK